MIAGTRPKFATDNRQNVSFIFFLYPHKTLPCINFGFRVKELVYAYELHLFYFNDCRIPPVGGGKATRVL